MIKLLVLCGMLLPFFGIAQTYQDSITLAPITITANRLIPHLASSHYDYLDAKQLQWTSTQNIAEALRAQSTVYVKSYGAGSIATSSIRGGGAGHTLVLWNGLPLNTAYLGQTDFSLLPSFFFDEIAVQYGGNAALYGNAAIGGVVHLNSRFSGTSSLQFQSSLGSFGKHTHAVALKKEHQKWTHALKWIHQKAEHDFPYRVAQNSTVKILPHANTRQTGILLENQLQYNSKQSVGWYVWWQQLASAIPPTTTQRVSVATQKDESLRTTLNWRYAAQRQLWQARTAFFIESIDYQDSLAGVDALTKGWTSISELEHQVTFNPVWKLYTGLNFTRLSAKASGYTDGVAQARMAFYSSIQQQRERWNMAFHLRQEWVDGTFVPLLPSLELGYQFCKQFRTSLTATRNYKLPTFNDLYWQPGGNPTLLPESGWGQALDGQYSPFKSLNVTFSAFHRVLKNRILWQPQKNSFIWSPDNIDQVWSRGFAVRLQWSTQWRYFQLQSRSGYDYVRSTVIQTQDTFALNKQLIYTPQHQGFTTLQMEWNGFSLIYLHQYTGPVFIQHRNATTLAGYQIGNFVLHKELEFKAVCATLQYRLNNIWNADYRVIERRPMPGRNFEITIFFKLNY